MKHNVVVELIDGSDYPVDYLVSRPRIAALLNLFCLLSANGIRQCARSNRS